MKRQSVTEHDKLYGFMKLAMNLSIVMVVVIVASTVFVLVQEGFTVDHPDGVEKCAFRPLSC